MQPEASILDQISVHLVMQHDYYFATFVTPSEGLYLVVLYAMRQCALRRSLGALRLRNVQLNLSVFAQPGRFPGRDFHG